MVILSASNLDFFITGVQVVKLFSLPTLPPQYKFVQLAGKTLSRHKSPIYPLNCPICFFRFFSGEIYPCRLETILGRFRGVSAHTLFMLSLKNSTHYLRLACVSFVGETEKFTGTENVDTINIARNVVSVSLMLFFWFLSPFLSGKISMWSPTSQILNKKARSSDLDLFLFKNLGEVPKPLFFFTFTKKGKTKIVVPFYL